MDGSPSSAIAGARSNGVGDAYPLGESYSTQTSSGSWAKYTGWDMAFRLSGDLYSGQGGAVPEPITMLLLGFGLVGLAGIDRRKLKKQQIRFLVIIWRGRGIWLALPFLVFGPWRGSFPRVAVRLGKGLTLSYTVLDCREN